MDQEQPSITSNAEIHGQAAQSTANQPTDTRPPHESDATAAPVPAMTTEEQFLEE